MSTYSTSLRLELIGAGDQPGIWGNTTNNNLGPLMDQAVAGVTPIAMDGFSGTYTLLASNGAVDEARSAVIDLYYNAVIAAANFTVVIPTVKKLYTFVNTTGRTATIKTAAQTLGIPVLLSGEAMQIYCDGANASVGWSVLRPTFQTLAVSGISTLATGSISGIMTAPTAATVTNTTQLATTAFVHAAITAAATTVIPTGTKMLFMQAAAPTGWTLVSTFNDRCLYINSASGGAIGGTASPLTMSVVPSHTHTYSTTTDATNTDHTHTYTAVTGGAGASAGVGVGSVGASTGGMSANQTHTHTVSGTTAGNAGASNWTPKYATAIVCSKN